MKKKRCTVCKIWNPLKDFPPNKHGKDGRQSQCRFCLSKKAAIRYAAKVGKPVKKRKPNLESWQPLPGDKFDAYLGHNRCILGSFVCVKNGPDKVAASTEGDIWQLDKAEFVFLQAG